MQSRKRKNQKSKKEKEKDMTPNEYQQLAKETLSPESDNLNYLTLGLASEAGEVAGKLKKVIRGDVPYAEQSIPIAREVGDCLWYCAMILENLGLDMEWVMRDNIQKLQARKHNGTIKGDGDNR